MKNNISKLKKNKNKIIGYGSPAKATTALNFFGISNEIDYIVEDNKLKHNKFVPGVKIPIINGTVPHKIIGKHGASRVIIKPAAPGTGIIAGGGVRAVMEQVGIHNVLTKRYGSKNSSNMVFATLNGLLNLKDAVAIANKRGIKIGEVFS